MIIELPMQNVLSAAKIMLVRHCKKPKRKIKSASIVLWTNLTVDFNKR
jgi:hypothetical protein